MTADRSVKVILETNLRTISIWMEKQKMQNFNSVLDLHIIPSKERAAPRTKTTCVRMLNTKPLIHE